MKSRQEKLDLPKEFISDVTDIALFVRTSDEEVKKWDKQKITESLLRETKIKPGIASGIAAEVERKIIDYKIKVVTAPLVRELVNAELLSRGLEKTRRRYTRLGAPLYDVENIIIAQKNKDNANLPHGPEATNFTLAEKIKKEYALLNVFSQDVADAHLRGDIHLHDLGEIDRPYSFLGDETIMAKYKNEIIIISLKQLFDMAPFKYEEGEFAIGLLKDCEVADKNGWTKLKRVARHKADKKMLWIRTENGRSVVVTQDHPMILKNNEVKKANNLKIGEVLKTPTCLFKGSHETICLLDKFLEKQNLTKLYIDKVSIQIKEKKIIKKTVPLELLSTLQQEKFLFHNDLESNIYFKDTLGRNYSLPSTFPLTEEFCWLIGYFIAEGHYEANGISFVGRNDLLWGKLKKILAENQMIYTESRHGETCQKIRIHRKILHDFFYYVLKIGKRASNKSLPESILQWRDKYLFSVISGIIDGDGAVTEEWRTRVLIRVSSRVLINQIQQALLTRGMKGNTRYQGIGSVRQYKGKIIKQNYPLYAIEFGIPEQQIGYFSQCCKLSKIKPADERYVNNAPESAIQDIKEIPLRDKHVYDITTASSTFLCNGILVHNCAGQSLEYIKKFGLDLATLTSQARPAKHPEVLIAHLLKFSASLQCTFAGAIGWDAINLFLAPFLVGRSKKELKQLAQILIYEFNQQAVARGGQAIFSDINIYWEVPKHFSDTLAIGPGGKYTGKKYKDYEKEAQNFAMALFENYLEGDSAGRPFFWPKPNVHMTEKLFQTPNHDKFLNFISEVASSKGNTYYVFDRGETAKISECCRLTFKLGKDDLKDAKTPWKMRYSAMQNITINLPRIAYRARGSDEILFAHLTNLMELTAKAHRQKRLFIERLLNMGQNGPLAFLTIKRDHEPYYRLDKASHLIGMVGLNEMVQYHIGQELHESIDALKFGLKVIAHMNLTAGNLSKKYGLEFNLEQSPAETTAYRFARLDYREYQRQAIKVLKGNPAKDEIYYTNSTLLNLGIPIDPIERVKTEGIFHPLINAGSISHIWLGESNPPALGLANFVKKTFQQTTNDQITFSPEFTSCNDCGRTARGLKEKCSFCGSKNIDGITRVTGYFSRTSMWNKGKIGELKDRYRNGVDKIN